MALRSGKSQSINVKIFFSNITIFYLSQTPFVERVVSFVLGKTNTPFPPIFFLKLNHQQYKKSLSYLLCRTIIVCAYCPCPLSSTQPSATLVLSLCNQLLRLNCPKGYTSVANQSRYLVKPGTVKCTFKNNLELRISSRQTNTWVQYLSTSTSVVSEFSKSTVANLTHFSRKMRILFRFFSDLSQIKQ